MCLQALPALLHAVQCAAGPLIGLFKPGHWGCVEVP
jgi:hypothetical protein